MPDFIVAPFSFAELPLAVGWLIFGGAAVVIAIVGTRLTEAADRLADQTGLGEAVVGAVFLGACTSLPGITASVTAALDARPALALSNALGGIAAQTAFLAVADLAYLKANLEHAAASVPNMVQGALLIALLSMLLIGFLGPDVSWGGIHLLTPLLFLSYVLGMRVVYQSQTNPMWRPRMTTQTAVDVPEKENLKRQGLNKLWVTFGVAAVVVVAAGWVLTRTVESLAEQVGFSDSLAGGLLTAVSTSLPELVTSVAAVRRGALTLAVGGVIGGNAFDTLFAAVADLAYRSGSIYHAATPGEPLLVALTILMSSILLMGMLSREKSGFGNIGFEGPLVLVLYIGGIVMLAVM